MWISLSILAAFIANNKGNSGLVCFLEGIIFSPLIGLFVAIASKPNFKVIEERKIKNERLKKCEFCAELIKKEALICHYCKHECSDNLNKMINSGA